MKPQIAITLPVKDLERSKAFFTGLGFGFDARFGSEHGAGMIVSKDITVMLALESMARTLCAKPLADPRSSRIALLCLFCDSRDEVDAIASKALALGGALPEPREDHGFMVQHGFEDPDGHMWALTYIESMPEQQAPPAEQAAA
jgi:predicted lactoylglutathione lyase